MSNEGRAESEVVIKISKVKQNGKMMFKGQLSYTKPLEEIGKDKKKAFKKKKEKDEMSI